MLNDALHEAILLKCFLKHLQCFAEWGWGEFPQNSSSSCSVQPCWGNTPWEIAPPALAVPNLCIKLRNEWMNEWLQRSWRWPLSLSLAAFPATISRPPCPTRRSPRRGARPCWSLPTPTTALRSLTGCRSMPGLLSSEILPLLLLHFTLKMKKKKIEFPWLVLYLAASGPRLAAWGSCSKCLSH